LKKEEEGEKKEGEEKEGEKKEAKKEGEGGGDGSIFANENDPDSAGSGSSDKPDGDADALTSRPLWSGTFSSLFFLRRPAPNPSPRGIVMEPPARRFLF
jgi:hypothetical protein